MAFQDNSGDIILDVVLTDEGRKRLAEGNFNITKYSFADDEINYELFDTSQATALQDLSILQTPILEAFTNNIASCKYRLISPALTSAEQMQIQYLPVIKLNTRLTDSVMYPTGFGNPATGTNSTFVVTANDDTYEPTSGNTGLGFTSANQQRAGLMNGGTGANGSAPTPAANNAAMISIDTGYDTSEISAITNQGTMQEDMFFFQMDNRLLFLRNPDGSDFAAGTSAVDDDSVATYIVQSTDAIMTHHGSSNSTATQSPLGGDDVGFLNFRIQFKLGTNQTTMASNFLFNKI